MTMWEVLTLSKQLPLSDLSDTQVVDNLRFHYDKLRMVTTIHDLSQRCLPNKNSREPLYPLQPPCCPSELYDLIRECWNADEAMRPTFREILMFLKRKNAGYRPPPPGDYRPPPPVGYGPPPPTDYGSKPPASSSAQSGERSDGTRSSVLV